MREPKGEKVRMSMSPSLSCAGNARHAYHAGEDVGDVRIAVGIKIGIELGFNKGELQHVGGRAGVFVHAEVVPMEQQIFFAVFVVIDEHGPVVDFGKIIAEGWIGAVNWFKWRSRVEETTESSGAISIHAVEHHEVGFAVEVYCIRHVGIVDATCPGHFEYPVVFENGDGIAGNGQLSKQGLKD